MRAIHYPRALCLCLAERTACLGSLALCFGLAISGLCANAQSVAPDQVPEEWSLKSSDRQMFDDPFDEEAEPAPVRDPIEKVNRKVFQFNDRVYRWIIKPVAGGYRRVLPEPTRLSFQMFFSNIQSPVRVANSLFQGKLKGAGREASRFAINSTLGIGGLFDPATYWKIEPQEEDLDQTLGFYGVPPGSYIHWPILGPSSVRGTIGRIGDSFLNPIFYVGIPVYGNAAISAHERINRTSLALGDYERFTNSALDPYVGFRNAYYQNREKKIHE